MDRRLGGSPKSRQRARNIQPEMVRWNRAATTPFIQAWAGPSVIFTADQAGSAIMANGY
jgi:hypothetical protein